MSMLAALKSCYDRLAEDQDNSIAPYGYSEENISFALVLSSAGTLVDQPIDLRIQSGRRFAPRRMLVPQSFKRPGTTPRSFFLWDKVSYVLGIGEKPKDRTRSPRPPPRFPGPLAMPTRQSAGGGPKGPSQ